MTKDRLPKKQTNSTLVLYLGVVDQLVVAVDEEVRVTTALGLKL